MAKAIIDGKMYDTEKAEALLAFSRVTTTSVVVFGEPVPWPSTETLELYKTAKGNFFEYNLYKKNITPIAKQEAQEVIRRLAPDLYVTLFGEVEEA